MTNNFGFSKLAVLAAGVSLLATPVAALDLPNNGRAEIATGVSDQADWGDHRRHRGGGGIGTGDVLAGVLVIGAIAAIAGAADGNSRDNDRRQARYPEPDYRANYRANSRADSQSARGIDNAVSMCVDQVERGSDRVESVDTADRASDGWRVSGSLGNGAGWNCWIDNDGRIREVNLGDDAARYSNVGTDDVQYRTTTAVDDRYSTGVSNADRYYVRASNDSQYNATPAEGQLSDDVYARARAAQRGTVAPESSGQPAYPGGPLPGEEGYGEPVQFSSAR